MPVAVITFRCCCWRCWWGWWWGPPWGRQRPTAGRSLSAPSSWCTGRQNHLKLKYSMFWGETICKHPQIRINWHTMHCNGECQFSKAFVVHKRPNQIIFLQLQPFAVTTKKQDQVNCANIWSWALGHLEKIFLVENFLQQIFVGKGVENIRWKLLVTNIW